MRKNKIKRPLIIIPARLGSKRLKNKNILPVKGLPMFVYVAKKVQKSIFSPYIFVSSESQKIEKICKFYNLNYLKRPKILSFDNVEKQLVIVHAVRKIEKKLKFKPEIIISLQANSPEIKVKHLDEAIKIFKRSFINKRNKELISVGKDNLQNAAFRIMSHSAVFQKSLSTNIIVYKKDYKDIHNQRDYLKVLKKI